jgi:aryl carrier-like protein
MIERPNKPLLDLLESLTPGPSLDVVETWKDKHSTAIDVTGQEPLGALTDLESAMRQAWAAVLGIPEHSIRPNDDFFRMGANSMRAVRLVTTLRESGYSLVLADIFRASTLAGMSFRMVPLPPGCS